MSKNKQKKDKKNQKPDEGAGSKNQPKNSLSKDIQYAIFGVITLCVGIILLLSLFNASGPAGHVLYRGLHFLFGVGYILLPIFFFLVSVSFFKTKTVSLLSRHGIGAVLFLISSLGLVGATNISSNPGGIVGKIVAYPFLSLLGAIAGVLVLGAILFISIFILFNTKPEMHGVKRSLESLKNKFNSKKEPRIDHAFISEDTYDQEEVATTGVKEIPSEPKPEPITQKEVEEVEEQALIEKPKAKRRAVKGVLPPVTLLEKDRGKPNTGDIKANANIIKRTLQNFGIEVEMDEITIGPTVTRYALKPAEGVKLSRIVALQQDLSLALAAHPLRVEAPIPGKSLVGIEIPNKAKSIIGLSNLFDNKEFKESPKNLLIALGKNVSGKPQYASLAKMPHCLIAGATGSGKSVTIHTLIASLLYKNTSEELRFIFVDPKRVELTLYNGIPHLLTPVITDPKKAILALKWAAKEMERRYDILESHKVRDISSYHNNILHPFEAKYEGKETPEDAPEKMPYIVVIIDELADIMQAYPRELESGIVRLAQMSRAVGIHLVLSTQRPSVNVITGLIKANIPARVALQVASQIDSRTILDQPGAEKLLGAGDMLFSSGEMASPERIQCPFISEDEVKSVVKFIRDNTEDVGEEISLTPGNGGGALGADTSIFSASIEDSDADDELYEEARQIVIENQKASTSFLQRKLGVGYARAARLIDMLEEHGVIGPGNGAKPRDVLEKSIASERAGFGE